MGHIEKNIVAQAKRFNEKIPDRILNKPTLFVSSRFFLDAFLDLDTDRPSSMGGLCPIPWSSIHRYAKAHELVGTDYEDFIFLVRRLDNAYTQHKNASEPNNGNTPKPS